MTTDHYYDGYEISDVLESPQEVKEKLSHKEWAGLLALAKAIEEDMMADPDEYGYSKDDFYGTDEEYEAMMQGHRDYGRLADMDSFTVFRHPDGRVSVRAIMTMSHVDRYHMDKDGVWEFEEP